MTMDLDQLPANLPLAGASAPLRPRPGRQREHPVKRARRPKLAVPT